MWNEISCTKLQLPPEPMTRELLPPDTRSLCPLSSTEFVETPEKNSWVRHWLSTICFTKTRLRTKPLSVLVFQVAIFLQVLTNILGKLNIHEWRPWQACMLSAQLNIQIYGMSKIIMKVSTWSDNTVRELGTVCLPGQHWTKALVWFDDIDISAFHSCVVVDLRQFLSEWHLLFCQQLMDLASRQCTCSHGTVCEGVFSY
jgi:hypothetical protein